MQQTEQDPEEVAGTAPPRQSDDRPPVGEPLVVSRRNPAARPARPTASIDGPPNEAERAATAPPAVAEVVDPRSAQLDGRVALVTSAAGELGAAFAAELVGRGARVLLVDVDLAGLLDVADALSFGRVVPLRCDLGSDADITAACEFVTRSSTVDLVVHVDGDGGGGAGEGLGRLDERYRAAVRGPVALFHALARSFGPSPQVVLVERSGAAISDVLAGAALGVVRDHLPAVEGMRVSSVACGPDLEADTFAVTVMDLLLRCDVRFGRVALAGGADPVTVELSGTDREGPGHDGERPGADAAVPTGAALVAPDFDGIDDLGR